MLNRWGWGGVGWGERLFAVVVCFFEVVSVFVGVWMGRRTERVSCSEMLGGLHRRDAWLHIEIIACLVDGVAPGGWSGGCVWCREFDSAP